MDLVSKNFRHQFYQLLSNKSGIPKIYFYGQCVTGHKYQIMVMELLGPNLEDRPLPVTIALGLTNRDITF